MRTQLTPTRIADDAYEFSINRSETAQHLANTLRNKKLAVDVVAGLRTVTVYFEPKDEDDVMSWLQDVQIPSSTYADTKATLEIPVTYSGADIDYVCRTLNLTKDEFIELHTGCSHSVEMIGFTPGFAYVSGLSAERAVPRLDRPRPRTTAGSIGVSGQYSGIYALNGPGGWPIIGHAHCNFFDDRAEDPFLLSPGQRVKFRSV